MQRYDEINFDTDEVIATHLTLPATVISAGVLGRFDSLGAALEHVQSHGFSEAILAVQAPGEEELQFTEGALTALADRFYEWPPHEGVRSKP